ncbi:hypothetical protein DesfrDRAFT_1604 [Solidesulfovibrio fructosivorans JJ]]|uniref:TIR domain-containing protein n=1 Tax=Solidesulfovibrio fructosivorans JJ] TaxID=596151 RepID=E1JVF5_SOLFR|nr:toll/interleukin-1 receptor domain-containing protein [Solidesulfovibrio fructosivorans]EFL51749.1 hypothetical protein DesfrDRAFT_1604 [Solidesulfovibrio fructosivorans JJ]]
MEEHREGGVFISYCRENTDIASILIECFEELRVPFWIDKRNIGGGLAWADEISSALKYCEVMVLLYSSESNKSTYVRNEVTIALEKDKTIIPIRIEDISISENWEVLLKHCQFADAFKNPRDELRKIAEHVYHTLQRIKNQPYDDKLLHKYNKKWTRKSKVLLAAATMATVAIVTIPVLTLHFNVATLTTSEATVPTPNVGTQAAATPTASIPIAAKAPAPVREAAVAAPATPPAVREAKKPEVTVAAPGRQYAALTPPPTTQPAQTRLRGDFDVNARIMRFLTNYLSNYNHGSVADVMGAYAPRVDFFGTPNKSKSSLYKDMAAYFDRWQKRRSRLHDDVRIVNTDDPTVKRVTFSYDFYRERGEKEKQSIQTRGYYKSPKDNRWCSSGLANDTLTLRILNNSIQIIGETQNAVTLDKPKNTCNVIP